MGLERPPRGARTAPGQRGRAATALVDNSWRCRGRRYGRARRRRRCAPPRSTHLPLLVHIAPPPHRHPACLPSP
eukprot:8017246-Pyramimonas_sp.AAC.2